MKLPIQSVPVYRYNTCTPGYSSIEEGVNPALNWGKLAKCAIQCGAVKEHALCLRECGTNGGCWGDCLERRMSDTQFNCWRVC